MSLPTSFQTTNVNYLARLSLFDVSLINLSLMMAMTSTMFLMLLLLLLLLLEVFSVMFARHVTAFRRYRIRVHDAAVDPRLYYLSTLSSEQYRILTKGGPPAFLFFAAVAMTSNHDLDTTKEPVA